MLNNSHNFNDYDLSLFMHFKICGQIFYEEDDINRIGEEFNEEK